MRRTAILAGRSAVVRSALSMLEVLLRCGIVLWRLGYRPDSNPTPIGILYPLNLTLHYGNLFSTSMNFLKGKGLVPRSFSCVPSQCTIGLKLPKVEAQTNFCSQFTNPCHTTRHQGIRPKSHQLPVCVGNSTK